MEIKFTASVIEALDHVLRLVQGRYTYIPAHAQGDTYEELDAQRLSAPQPAWCNFVFFTRIKATPVRLDTRVAPTEGRCGQWKISREVEFHYKGRMVAKVHLIGIKLDGENRDNESMWTIDKIGYYRLDVGSTVFDPPTEWTEFMPMNFGYTGRLIEPERLLAAA